MRDPRWLGVLAFTAASALWSGQPLLALCATFGLSIALMITLARRYCLEGVAYRRALAHDRAHCGDSIELRVEISNLKLMPLAALEIEDQLPRHLSVTGGTVRATRAELLPCLYILRSMLPYERVTRHLQVHCERRGVHVFGPARWWSGDPLGAASRHHAALETDVLLVLPKVFPLSLDRLASQLLVGPDLARRRMFPDPLRAVGSRDYVSGDPLRSVDWRATARRGALMVRELEPSTAPAVQIILDFGVHAPSGDWVEPDELELAISVAASLAAHATRRGWLTGLRGNAISAGAPLALAPSSAPGQLSRALEALARAGSRPSHPLSQLLQECARDAHERAAWIVVTTQVDERARALLESLRRRGHALLLVLIVPSGHVLSLGKLPVRRVTYEKGWVKRDALVLAA
jgi:uncharacterized protein (DUF58 family)